MASLAIPPHAPGNSRLAVVVLVLVAAGSFANGVLRQSADVAPVVATAAEAPVAPPVAAPQPILQLARAEPPPAIRRARDTRRGPAVAHGGTLGVSPGL